ncbi:MAG: hypothetical protein K0R65_2408 [Crocinitomicaceae bacterium]|jgi:hypothetical protein|nr:hypothetical protein [Crocinitomicaceae bacterium]
MKFLITLISGLFIFPAALSQEMSPKLNKAIAKDNFRKVERIIKCQIKKNKKGVIPGNGEEITHAETFDWLVSWLKKHPNVEDAAWDKCAVKIMIYPGTSILGALFKTENGTREMCFHVQVGKLGKGNDKHVLVYKDMEKCGGFVKQQKENCAGK